jgi:protein-L-isoaspartate(D-aspartate) O-methyltransferase
MWAAAAPGAACDRGKAAGQGPEPTPPAPVFGGDMDEAPGEATAVATDWIAAARDRMLKEQLIARGIRDERVLAAMAKVPREQFIPVSGRELAYADHPVPIGHGQTISQPYIVALMTELAALDAKSRVLEIGTGSGYQAAVLGEVAAEVYSVEILAPLAERATATLAALGYANVKVRSGDGYRGWPEAAPFDAILVTAAPPSIPDPLKQQLAVGGRLVIPVGDRSQELRVLTRTSSGFDERTVLPVRFVPMTGEAQDD